MININQQLRKYFILIVLFSIIIITLFSNIGINYFFKGYVKQNKMYNDRKIISYINEYFSPQDLLSNTFAANTVMLARTENINIIIAEDGKVILDTEDFRMGRGRGMMGMHNNLENMQYNEYSLFRNTDIRISIGRVGSVLAQEDKNFLFAMNGMFLVSFILALILSIFISYFVSKKFLKPLLLIDSNVSLISQEKYSQLAKIHTNTYELNNLSQSINNLAQRIKSQELLRKRLTSDIAHELRTPLATLQSILEAFIDGVIEPTPEKLSSCYDEIIRLSKLVNDLSDLSKIENKDMKIDFKKVKLNKVLSNVLENFKPMLESNNISLNENIQEISIMGDKDRLSQVFINIISNSYKYTQPGGQILLTLKREDECAIVSIEDNGEGIDSNDIPHIFERFYRGDKSRSRTSGGTGIGLTIAKAIVESHNGFIEIESEKGKGTKVTISFPLNLQ